MIKKKPMSFKRVIIISLLLFLGLNFLSLRIVDGAIEPIIKEIAEPEIRRLTTEAIDEAIYENITQKVDINDLIVENKREGLEPTYSFNQKIYNTALTETTKDIERRLGIVHNESLSNRNINDIRDDQLQSIVYKIPLGVVTGLSLLSNLGPEIPVQLAIVRDVESQFTTNMVNGGINNTFFELFIDIEVDIQIVIPFFTDEEPITHKASLGYFYIPGTVPSYYGNGFSIPPPPPPTENSENEDNQN